MRATTATDAHDHDADLSRVQERKTARNTRQRKRSAYACVFFALSNDIRCFNKQVFGEGFRVVSIQEYRRIAVIGTSGSGKSTFAVEFGRRTGLPVCHMDRLFWDTNWTEKPEEEWREQEAAILVQDRWIVEGYIDGNHPERLRRAELVIYLDLPGFVCASHGLLRWWKYRKAPRPELPAGCTEKLNYSHLWTMVARKERRYIQAALERAPRCKVMVLKSKRAISALLKALSDSQSVPGSR